MERENAVFLRPRIRPVKNGLIWLNEMIRRSATTRVTRITLIPARWKKQELIWARVYPSRPSRREFFVHPLASDGWPLLRNGLADYIGQQLGYLYLRGPRGKRLGGFAIQHEGAIVCVTVRYAPGSANTFLAPLCLEFQRHVVPPGLLSAASSLLTSHRPGFSMGGVCMMCYAPCMKKFLPAWPVLTLFLLILGAGCSPAPRDAAVLPPLVGTVPSVAVDAEEALPEQVSLGGGIEHISYAFSTSSRARLELYGFPADQYAFRLAASDEAKSLAVWRDEAPADVIAGINAMYFLEDFSPAGFLVTEGEEQRDRVFDWDKSALLTITDGGALAIRATTEEPKDLAELTQAAQSYPLLILNGDTVLTADSGKVSRRSVVGTDTDGRVWIGVVVDGDVSLYRLGELLTEVNIPWKQVLNLDGGASSGFFLRGADEVFSPSFTPIPSVLFVEER